MIQFDDFFSTGVETTTQHLFFPRMTLVYFGLFWYRILEGCKFQTTPAIYATKRNLCLFCCQSGLVSHTIFESHVQPKMLNLVGLNSRCGQKKRKPQGFWSLGSTRERWTKHGSFSQGQVENVSFNRSENGQKNTGVCRPSKIQNVWTPKSWRFVWFRCFSDFFFQLGNFLRFQLLIFRGFVDLWNDNSPRSCSSKAPVMLHFQQPPRIEIL